MKKYSCLVGLAILLAGCAPVKQEYEPRAHAAKITDDHVVISDRTTLPYTRWVAPKTKAVILAVHGFNDYSNAFDLFAKDALKHGITTYAYDQRGFGQNQPKGIWGGGENLAQDFCDVAKAIKQKHPQQPLIFLSESMGGAVVIHASATCLQTKADGVILSAPAAWGGASMDLFYRALLWTVAHTMPDKEFTGEGLNIRATDNIEILRQLRSDPNVIKSTRADSIYGLQQLMDAAYAEVQENPFHVIPVLILYGDKDEVVPMPPITHIVQSIPEADFITFEQGYHMLLRDVERKQVYDAMYQWMEDRRIIKN